MCKKAAKGETGYVSISVFTEEIPDHDDYP